MMVSVFIGRRGVWCSLKLCGRFISVVLKTVSKESKSKNKCIIEFTLRTWMIFFFLMKNAAYLQRCVCVCVWEPDTPNSSLDLPVDNVAWLLDPLQTLRSITLLWTAPFIQLQWSPPQQIDSWSAQPSPQHRIRSVETSLLMPYGEFSWRQPLTRRSNLRF